MAGSNKVRRPHVRRPTLQRPRVLKTAALAWSFWRWLRPEQRRALYHLVRRHGPAIVGREVRRRRKRSG